MKKTLQACLLNDILLLSKKKDKKTIVLKKIIFLTIYCKKGKFLFELQIILYRYRECHKQFWNLKMIILRYL